ncbi:MAG: DUF3251 domain-containing protein [Candidatus Omnitrophota bacterium]|nr:DUF3251 domain-containing protein [Candidatus Omnitrophota bacterium]MDZ4241327.1 DUF3251 domain-containing protein [Candidatus Omnitrophota bacterium]
MARYPVLAAVVVIAALFVPTLSAEDSSQDPSLLEARVSALEDYTQKLGDSLKQYSEGLISSVETKIKAENGRVIALNPVSRKFSKIETNAGMLLIAVQKMQRLENGYRMLLNIGNPHAAAFGTITLKLRWGRTWDAGQGAVSYDDWRNSLTAGEYVYKGRLVPGEWTEVTVELVPAGANQLEYIECAMDVGSVELQVKQPSNP